LLFGPGYGPPPYSGGYYGGNYGYPDYSYSGAYPSTSLSSYYNPGTVAAIPADRARIQVTLPDAQAEVLFDGQPTRSTGSVRTYEPTDLQPGKTYSYTVTASWRQGDQVMRDVRRVEVNPGRTTTLDFTQPASSTDRETLPTPRVNP